MKVEKSHIRWVMEDCKKKGRKYYNKKGTKTQPKIDEKKLTKYNAVNGEIHRLMGTLKIVEVKHPSKNNPDRKTHVLYSETVAEMFGRKSSLKSVDYKKVDRMKDEAISKLCMVSVARVEEVKKQEAPVRPKKVKKEKKN